MKPQSAKAKGRNLQKWVRDQLIEELDIHPEDIESRSMGAGGEDLYDDIIEALKYLADNHQPNM